MMLVLDGVRDKMHMVNENRWMANCIGVYSICGSADGLEFLCNIVPSKDAQFMYYFCRWNEICINVVSMNSECKGAVNRDGILM